MKGTQAEKYLDPALSVLVEEGVSAVRTFTINKPHELLFQSARDAHLFATAMRHLDAVQLVESDFELVEEVSPTKLVWASKKETEIFAYGTLEFKPAPRKDATIVRMSMKYALDRGKLAQKIDELKGDEFEDKLMTDLRNFKALMETGEIPTTEGQPMGHCGRTH